LHFDFELDLSIIITHHRNVDLLRRCLKSFQEEIKDIEAEIIVVCSEYKPEMLFGLRRDFPDVIFLPFAQNVYHVRSVNKGLERAKGNLIFIINDDITATPGSLKRMIGFLAKNPMVGLLGPKLLNSDGSWQKSCFRFYAPLTIICRRTFLGKIKLCRKIIDGFFYKDKNLENEKGAEVDWVRGAAMLTRKDLVKKIGPLDEKFWHYFGDVDWCRRFWQNGYKVVFYSKAVFYHHHEKSSRGGIFSLLTNKMARTHLWEGIKYFGKWKKQSE
jgi:GT2 family glycosyltransferase